MSASSWRVEPRGRRPSPARGRPVSARCRALPSSVQPCSGLKPPRRERDSPAPRPTRRRPRRTAACWRSSSPPAPRPARTAAWPASRWRRRSRHSAPRCRALPGARPRRHWRGWRAPIPRSLSLPRARLRSPGSTAPRSRRPYAPAVAASPTGRRAGPKCRARCGFPSRARRR